MGIIRSINWTYSGALDSFTDMDSHDQQEFEIEPSSHECECPEPCNCDHENE
jgi:hypothetical protein